MYMGNVLIENIYSDYLDGLLQDDRFRWRDFVDNLVKSHRYL